MSAAVAINLAAVAGFIIGAAYGAWSMESPVFSPRNAIIAAAVNGVVATALTWLAGVA